MINCRTSIFDNARVFSKDPFSLYSNLEMGFPLVNPQLRPLTKRGEVRESPSMKCFVTDSSRTGMLLTLEDYIILQYVQIINCEREG